MALQQDANVGSAPAGIWHRPVPLILWFWFGTRPWTLPSQNRPFLCTHSRVWECPDLAFVLVPLLVHWSGKFEMMQSCACAIISWRRILYLMSTEPSLANYFIDIWWSEMSIIMSDKYIAAVGYPCSDSNNQKNTKQKVFCHVAMCPVMSFSVITWWKKKTKGKKRDETWSI